MITAYKKFWKQYTDFSGRSDRSDFWWAFLINTVLLIVLPAFIATLIMISSGAAVIADIAGGGYGGPAAGLGAIFAGLIYIWCVLYFLATLVGNVALGARRMRDAGYHWALVFLGYGTVIGFFIPVLNVLLTVISLPCQIAFLVLAAMPTKEGGYQPSGGQYNPYSQPGFQNQQYQQGQQFNQGQPQGSQFGFQNQQPFGGQAQQPQQNQPFGQQPFPNQQQFNQGQPQGNQPNFQAQQPFGSQTEQPTFAQTQQTQTFGQPQQAEQPTFAQTQQTQSFGQQQAEQSNPFNQAQQPFGSQTQQPASDADPSAQPFGSQAQQPFQEQPAQPESAQHQAGQPQQQSVFDQQFNVGGSQEQAAQPYYAVQPEPVTSEPVSDHPAETADQPEPAVSEESAESSSEESAE